MAYPTRLAWIDAETDGLPEGNDYSMVHILELALIVTDFDLNEKVGYHEVVALTKPGADRIRANSYVKDMHKTSGLLSATISATLTLEQVEKEMLEILDGEDGSYMIAGSGVAAFDHPLIKSLMPELAKKFAYYPFDIGVMRRTAKILSGKEIVSITSASYGDAKTHRAYADVQAHLEEAKKYREFFRALP